MEEINRKDFLKVAGIGSAAVAAPALPLTKHLITDSGEVTFRAQAGLPSRPLPAYATQIVEGRVDLRSGTGLVTSRVLAGSPTDTGLVGLPGLSRVIRITSVHEDEGRLRLHGVVEDRSQLRRGESAKVEIVVDRKSGAVHAPFIGTRLEHELTQAR
jgi:hypothetical protein